MVGYPTKKRLCGKDMLLSLERTKREAMASSFHRLVVQEKERILFCTATEVTFGFPREGYG